MITVLVVDDSAFMRKAISTMLDKDPGIKVVGMARDGQEGLDMVRKLNPDVVTMDIEMPRMDGLTALRHIMMEAPRPVLMVSSLTTEGAEATLKAMELGAVDFIPKQLSKVSLDIIKIEKDLIERVKTVAARRMRHARTRPAPVARPAAAGRPAPRPVPSAGGRPIRDVVAIGVSTGGPPVVQQILSSLPEDFPAGIVIAQHMPAAFTGPFAKRLDAVSRISVKEAENATSFGRGAPLSRRAASTSFWNRRSAGSTWSSPKSPGRRSTSLRPTCSSAPWPRPWASGGSAVILTGMGSDGCEGVRELKGRGGRALAQSDSTCVVYGMPKAIVDENLADEIVDPRRHGRRHFRQSVQIDLADC